MSGIAGIIHFDAAPVEPGLIEKMTSAMSRRGPDGIAHWVKGPVALGQCMLRTTPESLEERQPLANEDESLVLVMDGRVDNWQELRRELQVRGARLRDRSDAELVLRSYETWGEDCLARIDGDFAFVLWDARRLAAFCARDRTGSKPFCYHWSGKTLVVASELRGILSIPSVPRVLNRGMLAEFLAAEWHARDETLWDGILRLAPAHQMTVDSRGRRVARYWEPNLETPDPGKTDHEWFEHYREVLTDSVRRLSRSHRTVGYEVSGGLDSSGVFCLAADLRRAGSLPAPGIEGFTLAFAGEADADELHYARAVARHLGVPVREVQPSSMPLSWYAERARTHRTFPGYPNGAMAQGLMQEAAARGCRALLNGIGGDEWLGGSRAHYADALRDGHWRSMVRSFWADTKACGAGQAASWVGRHGLFPLLSPSAQRRVRRVLRKPGGNGYRDLFWLSPELRTLMDQRRQTRSAPSAQSGQRASQRELLGHLADAFHRHAAEMTESFGSDLGLEVRRPLYTPTMVQFAISSPARLRLRGDMNKYMHVQTLRGILPDEVRERKTKAEFSIVFRRHLDEMTTAYRDVTSGRLAGMISPEGTALVYRTYRDDPQASWAAWVLWGVLDVIGFLPGPP